MYLSTTAQAWLVIVVSLVALAALSSGATGYIVYRIVKKTAHAHTNGNGAKIKLSLIEKLFTAIVLTLIISTTVSVLNASGLFPNQIDTGYVTHTFVGLIGTFTGLIIPDDFREKIQSVLAKPIDKTGKEI